MSVRSLLVHLLMVLCAPPYTVDAQTLVLSTNLSLVPGSFDYGPPILHRVDEDGDGVADSFLQQGRSVASVGFEDGGIDIEYPHYRLVRVVSGQVCRGAWFNPKQLAAVNGLWNEYYARVSIVKAGTHDEIQVQYDTNATSTSYTWANIKSFSIDRAWVACQ